MKHLKKFSSVEEAKVEKNLDIEKVDLKDPNVKIKFDIVNPNPKLQTLHVYEYEGVCFHIGQTADRKFFAIIGIPNAVDSDDNAKYYDSVAYADSLSDMIKKLPEEIEQFKKENEID